MKSEFPDHWQLLPLEDVMEVIIDYRGKTPKKTAHGIPLITAKIVKGGRILEPAEFIAEEDYDTWMVRGLPEVGDVVVTSEAPLGETAQLTDSNVALAQRIVTLRGKKGVLNNDFLLCAMQSSYVQHQLESRASGSTVKGIKQSELRKILLPIPPEDEQTNIAHHIKTLSKKIELNRQTNQTLEHMAQAIFKSWFVDFEPTRAKAHARAHIGKGIMRTDHVFTNTLNVADASQADGAQQPLPKNFSQADADQLVERAAMAAISGKPLSELENLPAETLEQLKTTAALFPETLVDSELGEIPEGWQASTLGEHFNVVMGQSPKGDTYNEDGEGMLFFQGRRDFGFRYPTPRVYTTEPKRLAQAGDTLISVRAPVGDRNMADQECCLGRGVGGIRHKSGARSFTYAFIGHIEKNLGNSGSDGTVFSSINKKELEGVGFIAPSIRLLESFEKVVDSIDERVEINSKENVNLQTLRDSLLPKLLSGELSIEEPGSK